MKVTQTIKLEIKNQEFEITLAEAKELFIQLKGIVTPEESQLTNWDEYIKKITRTPVPNTEPYTGNPWYPNVWYVATNSSEKN